MAFQGVAVFEVREVLRLWLRGGGLRSIERLAVVDRSRSAATWPPGSEPGLIREGGEEQLTDVLVGAVCERVRPHRSSGHGQAWAALVANHDQLKRWLVEEELTGRRPGELLARQGVVVPERTLHRYASEVLGVGRSARSVTVRVADGEPGSELQVRLREDGHAGRSGHRPPPGGVGADLHGFLLEAHLRVVDASAVRRWSGPCVPACFQIMVAEAPPTSSLVSPSSIPPSRAAAALRAEWANAAARLVALRGPVSRKPYETCPPLGRDERGPQMAAIGASMDPDDQEDA